MNAANLLIPIFFCRLPSTSKAYHRWIFPLNMARISALSHILLLRMLLLLLCVSFCHLEMVFDQASKPSLALGNSSVLFLCNFIPYISRSFSILEFLVASSGTFISADYSCSFYQGTTFKTFYSVAISALLYSQPNH